MNIILYVSDSLRADRLSCYGYDRKTSPSIDQLAADGIQFDNAFSQAYKTVESSVSIVTGWYPPAHGVQTTHDSIPEDAPCIPERLREKGYTTAGFSSMPQVSARRAFDAGFDSFEKLYRTYGDEDRFTDWAKLCTDHVIDWLDDHSDSEPFYLFVWSNGTHDPYAPRAHEFTDAQADYEIDGSLASLRSAKRDDASHVQDLYDDTVRHSDAHFGRLLDSLRRRDLYDETLIVFLADHGELLSEHARLEQAYGPVQKVLQRVAPGVCESNTLFEPGAHIGHLGTLPYEELIHVPLIIKPPAQSPQADVCGGLVETVDVMPTIAELTGIEVETQGESLKPLFDGGDAFKEYVYSDTAISRGLTRSRSVRSADQKLIRTDWDLARLKRHGVLDLENVVLSIGKKSLSRTPVCLNLPDERTHASEQDTDSTATLLEALDDWLDNNRQPSVSPDTTRLDQETEDQLKELGYLD